MSRPTPAQSVVQPARRIAYDVIAAVRESDAYANLLLPTRIDRAKLSPADAALATELTYGTLRMRGYYDSVIALAARRPVETIDPPILDVLRLGAHQILATRVAQHAAVNESVALARSVGSRSSTGFVNGVLRALTRTAPDQLRKDVLAAATTADQSLSVEFSHPEWIVRAFRQALTTDGRADELKRLLAADNLAPRVNMVALPSLAGVPDAAERNRFSPYGFVFGGGDPHSAVQASAGAVRVQDEGSQLAALALAAATGARQSVRPNEEWLDLCAGPGGKSALLGALAQRSGARLVANELVPARAELVRAAIRPVAAVVDVWQRDGTTIGGSDPDRFDRVLVDAPCTGLGALRRRPEARWRKTPRDIPELSALQSTLIDSAVRALRPGGTLCYVTCSPHPAETRVAISDALRRHSGELEPMPTRDILNTVLSHPLNASSDPTQVQLWPHEHGTDAMFIALLRKRTR